MSKQFYFKNSVHYVSSSSSSRASSTNLHDPISSSVSIVHRSRKVFQAISCVGIELLYISSISSPFLCSSMWRGSHEHINYRVYMSKMDLFQIFQFSVSVQFLFCLHTVKCKNSKFQIIQFSLMTQFSSIWPIDKTLSGASTPVPSGLSSDDNEEVLRIHQSPSITGPHHQIL